MTGKSTQRFFARAGIVSSIALLAWIDAAPAIAQQIEPAEEERDSKLDVVYVTARKREENLQSVPVTANIVGKELVDDYQLDRVDEVARLVPNLKIQQGGTGAGGEIRLRGVGSSALSAAFDSAVAFNVDDVPINNARLVQNSFVDMAQISVLKGPQSLFFGKSSSAGVIDIKSADPGTEFEAGILGSYEFEEKTWLTSGYISGPLSDTLSARLAVQYKTTEEVIRNEVTQDTATFMVPAAMFSFDLPLNQPDNPERGEESLDARLTLDWHPTERFRANFKYAYTDFENDGSLSTAAEVFCRDGDVPQPVSVGTSILVPSDTTDCDAFNGVIQTPDVLPQVAVGLPTDVPFTEQSMYITRLKADFDLTDTLTLTSVTSAYNIEDEGMDSYNFAVTGLGINHAVNEAESFAQELRLQSSFEGPFNFILGAYYQDQEMLLKQYQVAFAIGLLAGPDLATGNTFDWTKTHRTEAETKSVFGSVDFQVTDRLTATAGVRWTDEEKTNNMFLDYLHYVLTDLDGNLVPDVDPDTGQLIQSGFQTPDYKFSDSNVSPEVSLVYQVSEDVNLYAAYKTGFKAGGIDNSLLPTGFGFVGSNAIGESAKFDSEEAEGFEFGIKSEILDNTARLNATLFHYVYEGLQVQAFSGSTFNYNTSNVGQAVSQGFELEGYWDTPVDGLFVRGALAYTDAYYDGEFIDQNGDDLDGMQLPGNSEWAAVFGLDYETALTPAMDGGFSFNANYTGDANVGPTLVSKYEQDGFVTLDARAFIGATDGGWEFSLIGANLTDEVVAVISGERPGAIPSANGKDVVIQTNRGRQVSLQAKLTF